MNESQRIIVLQLRYFLALIESFKVTPARCGHNVTVLVELARTFTCEVRIDNSENKQYKRHNKLHCHIALLERLAKVIDNVTLLVFLRVEVLHRDVILLWRLEKEPYAAENALNCLMIRYLHFIHT